MAIQVIMRHRTIPVVEYSYIGFSWITLFFSPIVMARRGQWLRAIFYFIMCAFLLFMSLFISFVYVIVYTSNPLLALICGVFLYALCMVPLAWSYNKQHMQWLLEKGYRFDDEPELNEQAAYYANADLVRSSYEIDNY